MAFHPYPQLIPSVFNLSGFAPPQPLTAASHWPWVDHSASGPRHATKTPSLGFGFPTATPHGLTSRHAADSQAHSSKGTPSHHKGCSDGLTAHGFRYYFTPLPGYFSPFPHGTIRYRSYWVFRLTGWSRQIHSRFHGPAATRGQTQPTGHGFHVPGSHRLRQAIPRTFR